MKNIYLNTGTINEVFNLFKDIVNASKPFFKTGERINSLKEFNGGEIAPGTQVTSKEELAEYVRNVSSTVWHPVGTCKMGIDEMAVVDPELRVYGIEKLRVADASIMPTITTGNTNAASIMIGEKAADMILKMFSQGEKNNADHTRVEYQS